MLRSRPPGIWERHWLLVCGGIPFGAVETALTVHRLVNRAKRHQAETVAGLGFYELGADPGQLFVDERLRTLLGLTPEDHHRVLEFWLEHAYPDDRERVQALTRRLVVGKQPGVAVQ